MRLKQTAESLDQTAASFDQTAKLPRPRKRLGGWGEVSLLTRIFLTNVAVVVAAALILILTPATVSAPVQLQEVILLVAGLTAILLIALYLFRRSLAPLARLRAEMGGVELLRPGRRVPIHGGDAEVVDLTEAFNDMLDRLERERRESVRRSLAAQEGERQRVAQELHDEVGQSLTAIMLLLDRLARGVPDDARGELIEARETARASLEEVRAITKRLRPEALDDLGLPSALAALATRLSEQTGLPIARRIDRALLALEPEVELVLYRVAQEALTNAVRHAGASKLTLALDAFPEGLSLVVTDDGAGIGNAPAGAGIQGMRERALMIGAELEVVESPEGRTVVSLHVPVRREL